MTRVASNQISQGILGDIYTNYYNVQQDSEELSTGLKVSLPGDSNEGGTIQEVQDSMNQLAGYESRIAPTESSLNYQQSIVTQGVNLITSAEELATQGANQTVDQNERTTLAQQVWQIRDQLVSLANSSYNGNYLWSGTASNTPPFSAASTSYTNSGDTASSERYTYTGAAGNESTNSVQVGNGMSITTNTPGDTVWANAISTVEQLGRALEGYSSTTTTVATPGAPAGVTDGGGTAYDLTTAAGVTQQTTDIGNLLDQLKTVSNDSLVAEQSDLGARVNRLQTADTMIKAAQTNGTTSLNSLQNADATTAASDFQQAEFALQASMEVNAKVLNMPSILNYI